MFFSIYVKVIVAILVAKLAGFNVVPWVTDGVGMASMLIGTVGAIKQIEIKKFFAYSSVTHVGFLVVGDLTAF
jgi:NADH:ubiquinone oxidoreductase subunit 2 (subunit N)